MHHVHTHTLELEGANIAWSQSGAGRDLVWCHGLGASVFTQYRSDAWDWSVLEKSSRVTAADARGHGQSTGLPKPSQYDWVSLADDLIDVLDVAAPHTRVIGVGISMGTGTLLHAASRWPERFAGLVLVTPPTFRLRRRLQSRRYGLIASDYPRRGIHALGRLMDADDRTDTALDELGRNWQISDQLTPSVLLGAAASDAPHMSSLKAVTCRTLVLAWQGDRSHPVGSATALRRWMPNASIHTAASTDEIRFWPTLVGEFVAGLQEEGESW